MNADPVERTPDARLARIHLRGGMMALARAELEQMAGALALDTPALADLAEARWRSGDLTGAADAAQAHIDAGGIEPMALLICAEALDHAGHLLDARALAAQVLERVGGHVDRLFAGEPRSSAWSTAGLTPTPMPPGTVAWGALGGGMEISDPTDGTWPSLDADVPYHYVRGDTSTDRGLPGSIPAGPPSNVIQQVEAGREAGRELDAVESAIESGRFAGVPERLALLLRHDRSLAPIVLSRADQALAATSRDDPAVAALHLVRGDAFRSLGHEAEATAAYRQSLRAVAASATSEESS